MKEIIYIYIILKYSINFNELFWLEMWQGLRNISWQSSESTLPDGMFKHETGPYFKTPSSCQTTTTATTTNSMDIAVEIQEEDGDGDGEEDGTELRAALGGVSAGNKQKSIDTLKLREIDADPEDPDYDSMKQDSEELANANEAKDELRSPQKIPLQLIGNVGQRRIRKHNNKNNDSECRKSSGESSCSNSRKVFVVDPTTVNSKQTNVFEDEDLHELQQANKVAKLTRKLQFNEKTTNDSINENDNNFKNLKSSEKSQGKSIQKQLEENAKSNQKIIANSTTTMQDFTSKDAILHTANKPKKSNLKQKASQSQSGSGDDSSTATQQQQQQQQRHNTFRSRLSSISGAFAHHAPVVVKPRTFAKLLFPHSTDNGPAAAAAAAIATELQQQDLRQAGSSIQITTTSIDSPKRKRSSSGRSWGSRDSGQSQHHQTTNVHQNHHQNQQNQQNQQQQHQQQQSLQHNDNNHHLDHSIAQSQPQPRSLSSSTSGRRLSQLFLPQVPPQMALDRLNQLDPYAANCPNELLPPNMLGLFGQAPLVGTNCGPSGLSLCSSMNLDHTQSMQVAAAAAAASMLGHRNSWADASLIGRLTNVGRPSLDSTGYHHSQTNRLRQHSFDARKYSLI